MCDDHYQVIRKVKSSQLTVQASANALLTTETDIIIGTTDGSLFTYNHSLELLHTSIQVINGSIDSIQCLNDDILLITHNDYEVSVYERRTNEVSERLPFKDITALDILKGDKFAISTKNLVLVYQWISNTKSLEMTQQYKADEKIITFKFTKDLKIMIFASNSGFYSLKLHSTMLTPQKIPFNSKYSIFSQSCYINEIPHQQLLLSKGTSVQIITKDLKVIKGFRWENSPRSIQQLDPFVILSTGNHIGIKDPASLTHDLQLVEISNIQAISATGQYLTVITQTKIELYEMVELTTMVRQIALWDVDKAISILDQFDNNTSTFPDRFFMLRELQINKAKRLFQKEKKYSQAIHIFSKYITSPMRVIELYPPFINGEETSLILSLSDDDKNALNLLAQFLSDSRRKLTKLLSSGEETIANEDGFITMDFFTEGGEYSIDEIKRKIDTTLFLTYSVINQGLIGSLVRVDNDCDPEVIVRILKSKEMNSELIDFYFKQGRHEDSLDLLLQLHPITEDKESTEIIKYLHRLRNDELPILMKYSTSLIKMNEKYAVDVFIDSPYCDTFKRISVFEFFQSLGTSLDLQRLYLEFLIFELKDKSQFFGNELVDIYWTIWEREDFSKESGYFVKIRDFLISGNFYLNHILSKYFTNRQNQLTYEMYVFQVEILIRLKRYEEVLDIQVNQLHDIEASVRFILDLYSKEPQGVVQQTLISFIKSLLVSSHKETIVKTLTILSNTIPAQIPLLEIFEIFDSFDHYNKERFQIQELSQVLIKYLRNERSTFNKVNLKRALYNMEIVAAENEKLEQESKSFEVVNNAQKCHVCTLDITNNSMLAYINPTTTTTRKAGNILIHLGCMKTFEDQKKSAKPLKLNTIRLKDYIP